MLPPCFLLKPFSINARNENYPGLRPIASAMMVCYNTNAGWAFIFCIKIRKIIKLKLYILNYKLFIFDYLLIKKQIDP